MAEETTARDRLLREMTHHHLYMDDDRANELIDDYARELAAEIRERAQFLAGDPTFVGANGQGFIDGMREGADTIDSPVGDG